MVPHSKCIGDPFPKIAGMLLPRWIVWLFLAVTLAVMLPGVARAGLTRPNALDRRVDAVSAATLLREPASALVDSDRQIAAAHLARSTLLGWLLGILAQAAVLLYFWRSGWAARTRDWLRRRVRSEGSVRFLFGGFLALLAKLASTIPDFYLYRVNRVMGISNEPFHNWGGDWLRDALLAMVAAGIVVWAVLWLVDRTHQWYLYTAAAVIILSVAIAYGTPELFALSQNRYEPLPRRFEMRVQRIEQRSGMAPIPIEIEERSLRSQLASAEVQGIGNTCRIVLSDTLLAGTTRAETLFVVARELRYIERNDVLRRALYDALLVILGIALAVFIADRIRFRRDDDALSRIALVGALLACAYIVVTPIDRAIQRSMAADADQFAIALTGNRAAAERYIVRGTDEGMRQVCPSPFVQIFLERTPTPGSRIAQINGIASTCRE